MSEVSDHEQKDEKVTLIEKPRRTKTAKQVEQFQKVILRKKEMDEKRKLAKQIEASKLLLKHDPEFLKQNSEVKESKSEKSKRSKKIIEKEYESLSGSSSSSESSISEEIPIKHKKEKKKKNKEVVQVKKSKPRKAKLIIYSESEESSTDSEQKSDSDHKPVHKRNFKSQQNKKSVLNIQNKDVKINIKPLYDPKNYFV